MSEPGRRRTGRLAAPVLAAFALAIVALGAGVARSDETAKLSSKLPKASEFHKHVRKVMKTYPMDGTHRYYWPRKGQWKGTTCDLEYQGKTIAAGDKDGRCFCCGLTFEVFFRAWQSWDKSKGRKMAILDLTPKQVSKLLYLWFGSDGNRKCILNAVETFKLGRRITKLEDARAGDFVQLWRHSGSGHSVVFVDWQRDKAGTITGLKYWSTQSSTKGIGLRTESIGPKGIKRDELYVVRIGR